GAELLGGDLRLDSVFCDHDPRFAAHTPKKDRRGIARPGLLANAADQRSHPAMAQAAGAAWRTSAASRADSERHFLVNLCTWIFACPSDSCSLCLAPFWRATDCSPPRTRRPTSVRWVS